MADSRATLRPYYVAPTIGREAIIPNSTASAKPTTFSFPDLDYSDYIPEAPPSLMGQVKALLDKALWKYTSVVIAQPFEVAKLILQTRVAQEADIDDGFTTPQIYEQEDSDDEPNYFSSSAPFESSPRSPTRGRRGRPVRRESQLPPDTLVLKSSHSIMDVLASLSSSGGAFAMWKGTNSTFIYTVLMRTLETFFRSFIAAVFGISENDIALGSLTDTSILASTAPLATVLIATASTAVSALLLAPIDAARTRLILTPHTQEPRSLLGTCRTLPSPFYIIPTHLAPITILSAALPTSIATATPLVLKNQLGLDPAINPTSWSMFTFLGSAVDLSVKFPLETVLRRAQISTWTSPETSPPNSQSKRKAIKTIVPVPQSYRGILPTMWGIMRDEGFSESATDRTNALMGKAPRSKRKGQGMEGLYRGWRVGLWGLVGVWGTSFVGGLQSGESGGASSASKF